MSWSGLALNFTSETPVRNDWDSARFTVIVLLLGPSSTDISTTAGDRAEIFIVVLTALSVSLSWTVSNSSIIGRSAGCSWWSFPRKIIWFSAAVCLLLCPSFSCLKQGFLVLRTLWYSCHERIMSLVRDRKNDCDAYMPFSLLLELLSQAIPCIFFRAGDIYLREGVLS